MRFMEALRGKGSRASPTVENRFPFPIVVTLLRNEYAALGRARIDPGERHRFFVSPGRVLVTYAPVNIRVNARQFHLNPGSRETLTVGR